MLNPGSQDSPAQVTVKIPYCAVRISREPGRAAYIERGNPLVAPIAGSQLKRKGRSRGNIVDPSGLEARRPW